MRKTIIAVLGALTLLASGCTKELAQAPEARFAAVSGEAFSTSDLRGRVLLVNFWATSCVVCLREMPRMIEAYRKFSPRGYEMVAVAMSYDHPNTVVDFARKRALPFKVALDPQGEIAKRFGDVSATPVSFLIDRQGRIVRRYVGEPDWAEFHEAVERALAS